MGRGGIGLLGVWLGKTASPSWHRDMARLPEAGIKRENMESCLAAQERLGEIVLQKESRRENEIMRFCVHVTHLVVIIHAS